MTSHQSKKIYTPKSISGCASDHRGFSEFYITKCNYLPTHDTPQVTAAFGRVKLHW
jgi:hypothetical protein